MFETSELGHQKLRRKLTLVIERNPLHTAGAFNFERDRAVVTTYASCDGTVAGEWLHSMLASMRFGWDRTTCCFLVVRISTQSCVNAVVTFALDDFPLASLSNLISNALAS